MTAFALSLDGRVRVGLPVPTNPLAAALSADGHGCLVVYRDGHVEYTKYWPEKTGTSRLCECTDGARNKPLINCPHCRGEGTVRAD